MERTFKPFKVGCAVDHLTQDAWAIFDYIIERAAEYSKELGERAYWLNWWYFVDDQRMTVEYRIWITPRGLIWAAANKAKALRITIENLRGEKPFVEWLRGRLIGSTLASEYRLLPNERESGNLYIVGDLRGMPLFWSEIEPTIKRLARPAPGGYITDPAYFLGEIGIDDSGHESHHQLWITEKGKIWVSNRKWVGHQKVTSEDLFGRSKKKLITWIRRRLIRQLLAENVANLQDITRFSQAI